MASLVDDSSPYDVLSPVTQEPSDTTDTSTTEDVSVDPGVDTETPESDVDVDATSPEGESAAEAGDPDQQVVDAKADDAQWKAKDGWVAPSNGDMMTPDLNAFCEDLYREVQQYWEDKLSVLPRTGELKFGIFYSPVQYRPTLMIIGANPGFDTDDDTKGPPPENLFYEYPPPEGRMKEQWEIARVLRQLFKLAHHEETLRGSVVTNLLFFKSRCLDTDKKTCQGWRDNGNAKARREIEDYCRDKVKDIVSQLDPTQILVLGMASWDKLADGQIKLPVVRPKRNVRLAVMGTVFNKSALGIIHPTGARISRDECSKIAEHLGEFLRH